MESIATTRAGRTAEDQRELLRVRHSAALTSLMETRADLRGVNAWADFVDDAVRWSA
jgi:hypothetical protein